MSYKEEEIKEYVRTFMVRIFKGKEKVSLSEEKSFIDKLIVSFDELKLGSAESVLDFHFLLQDKVIEFLREFPELIEKYRYTTGYSHSVSKGQIRGAIDWNRTIENWNHGDARSKQDYVYLKTARNDYTKENYVLYVLVHELFEIVDTCKLLEKVKGEPWFFSAKKAIVLSYETIIKHSFLSTNQNIAVDDKTIDIVLRSKNELYRRSAEILKNYYSFKNGTKKEIVEVLAKTFIDCCNPDTCFELYWIFKLIAEKTKLENVDFKTVLPRQHVIAQWKDKDQTYTIFHNCNSTGKISFDVKDCDLKDDPQYRYDYHTLKALNRFNAYRSRILSNANDRHLIFNGRPDFVIEVTDGNDDLVNLLIGEVKNSRDIQYVYQGLFELTQYLEYVGLINKGVGSISKKIKIYGILCSHVAMNNPEIDKITWRYYGDSNN